MSVDHGDHTHPGTDSSDLSSYAGRIRAIEALLVEKGILTSEEIHDTVENVEARSPTDGAVIVAHAWADPEFKSRLLANPHGALAELGYELPETTPKIAVVENTEAVHHLVVCTLCSCYPRALLGRPPDWYKSFSYRSRAVNDPRGVMKEFGTAVPEATEVRVLDSTADLRYLVLPKRPDGTEELSEEELAKLVTRDSMVGVTEARSPEAVVYCPRL